MESAMIKETKQSQDAADQAILGFCVMLVTAMCFFLPLFDIFGKNAPETIARMQKFLGGASLTHISFILYC